MVQRSIVRWLHRYAMGAGHVSKGIVLVRRRLDVWRLVVVDLDPLAVAVVTIVMMIFHHHRIHCGLGDVGDGVSQRLCLAVAVLVVVTRTEVRQTHADSRSYYFPRCSTRPRRGFPVRLAARSIA